MRISSFLTMTKKLLFAGLLLSATACHKDKTEPTIDFGPNNGFTMRTATNLPVAQTDPTDWTTDPTWTDTERGVFDGFPLPLTGPQLAARTWETSAYPNPCSLAAGCDIMVIPNRYGSPVAPTDSVRVRIEIVDAHYNHLSSYDLSVGKGLFFEPKFDPAKYAANTLYRLYYVVYKTGKQVYYRGHGDIKIES